jgi:hypothetical protein
MVLLDVNVNRLALAHLVFLGNEPRDLLCLARDLDSTVIPSWLKRTDLVGCLLSLPKPLSSTLMCDIEHVQHVIGRFWQSPGDGAQRLNR